MDADPCPCGSPFPSIHVVGRTDDILVFTTPRGEEVQILPLAIATVAEETPGVAGCQLIQRTPSSLTVRLRVENPRDEEAVWAALRNRLAAFLSAHGATTVTIEKADEAPALHPRSGKFREVYSELTPERGGRPPRSTMTPTPDCDSTTTADHGFTADRAGPLGLSAEDHRPYEPAGREPMLEATQRSRPGNDEGIRR